MTHIVDTLIEERATKLRQHPFIWKLIQEYLYPVFGYQTTIDLVDEVQGLSGYEVFEHVSKLLGMKITVEKTVAGSPADGVLLPGDRVVGVGATLFSDAADSRKVLGDAITLVDSAEQTALEVSAILEQQGLNNSSGKVRNSYFVSI